VEDSVLVDANLDDGLRFFNDGLLLLWLRLDWLQWDFSVLQVR
jgi:hypothetical protein